MADKQTTTRSQPPDGLDAAALQSIVRGAMDLTSVWDRCWVSYDREADVLYVNCERAERADDSDLTDDDILIRYRGDKVVGVTVLHASKRDGLRLR